MATLEELNIRGLFGYMDRTVTFMKDDPTILTGPNGSGKTQILRILHSLLQLEVSSLSRLPVRSASATFIGGSELAVDLERTNGALATMTLRARGSRESSDLTFTAEDLAAIERKVIESSRFFEQTPSGFYLDRRTGRRMSLEDAQETYGLNVSLRSNGTARLLASIPNAHGSLHDFLALVPPVGAITIDTKRLDTALHFPDLGNIRQQPRRSPDRVAASRIEGYLAKISDQIDDGRMNSIMVNQNSDTSFAIRALDKAHDTVGEADIRRQYGRLVQQSAALAANRLHSGDTPPPLPEKRMNPTEKRILAVFLEDWRQRLEPLLPVNRRINLFREILDRKLQQSFKATLSTPDGIAIGDSYGSPLKVAQLSSGEQHLVALFTRLLFDARSGTLVLIDEPEISLHAAWQHEFIEDLERVGELVDIQVVIATHSPAIVNGRWELEVVLRAERPPQALDGAPMDVELNDLTDADVPSDG